MTLDKSPPARKESSALFLQREMQDILKSDPSLIQGIVALISEALVSGLRERGSLYVPADSDGQHPDLKNSLVFLLKH